MKLILSFSVIALLVGILSIYSVLGIGKSADGFTSYREMARDSVLAGRVQANMLMVRMNVKDYLSTTSQKDIDEFNHYYEKTNGFIKEALKEIQNPTRAPFVKTIAHDMTIYKDSFYKVIKYMEKRNNIVHNNLEANGKKIEQLLTAVMKSAKRDADLEASLNTAQGIRTLLLARLYTSKFLASNSKAHSNRAKSEFNDLEKKLTIIRNSVENPKRRSQLKEAMGLIKTYQNGVMDIITIIRDRNNIIDNKLNKIGPEIAKLAEDVKLSIKKDQDTIGPEVAKLNTNLQKSSVTISLVIIGIVILLSIFIPRTISNLIEKFQNGLMHFFQYLNREKDKVSILEESKDEIGVMSRVVNKSINKIKSGLEQDKNAMEDLISSITKVNHGYLDARIEATANNPALIEAKDIINSMIETLEKSIGKDINKIKDVLQEYSNLDYRKRIDNNSGLVDTTINELGDSIIKMLKSSYEDSQELLTKSDILQNKMDNLKTSALKQSSTIEETALSIDQVTQSIEETSMIYHPINGVVSSSTK